MLSNLQAQGVQIDGTVRQLDQQATGTALVMLLPSGENSIIIVGGANTAAWSLSQQQKDAILQAKSVLLQREIPDSVNLQVAQMCRQAGVDVILDAGGAEGPMSAELLSCLSILSPNETELSRMTEMAITSPADVLAACKLLQQQGASDVLVKLGSRGSVLVTSTHTSCPLHGRTKHRQHVSRSCMHHSTPFMFEKCLGQRNAGAESGDVVEQQVVPVKHVVDTTGAGDCFTAAFGVARFVRGLDEKDALRFASAAAALCIQSVGAMSSMPSAAQVQAITAV